MMVSVRKASLPILLISALLLALPAMAQKVPPEEQGDAAKYAAGGGQPNPNQGPVPPNDECVNATPAAVPSTVFGTTVGSTIDPFPTCGTTITAGGVWISVIGDGNTYTASTCDGATNYDTKISVFCQDCANPTCVGGNDDGGSGNPTFCSEIAFCTEAGAQYNILVHGFGAATGDFELTLSDDGVPCAGGVMCLPTGACCDDMGGCAVTNENACDASGGTYQGDGSECFTPDGAPTTYSATPGTPIPDNDPVGITSIINVPDSFAIADVNVDLTITHTFIDDLIVTLTHPDGAPTVFLWNRGCGSEDNLDVTLDDEAGDVVCASPTVGSINPPSVGGGFLSDFDGLDAQGNWTLTVSDNVGADTGTLDAWGLVIDSGTPACAVGGGNFDIEIPTLNQVGLAILALLLAGGAIFLIRRRA